MHDQLNRRTLIGGVTLGAAALASGRSTAAQTADPADQLRRFINAAYGDADPATIDATVADVIADNWIPEDNRDDPGREALKERLLAGNDVFQVLWQSWTTTVDDLFATEDRAAARFTVHGTGFDGGRSSLSILIIAQAKNGKLLSAWTGAGTLVNAEDATPTA